MPRRKKAVPAYTLHRPSGQAYVRIPDGAGGRKTVYLGAYDTPESRAAYARIVAELQAAPVTTVASVAAVRGVTVNEVLLAFLGHAERHYRRPDGTPTREVGEFKQVIRAVRRLYGDAPAAQFGPRALKAVRDGFVAAGWCRTLVNRRTNRIRHLFKWAAGEELVPGSVWQDLRAVPGLQAGRTPAPETDPVAPVPDDVVDKTLPYLTPTVAAMVRVQRLTGMRPGEVCLLRPADVDRSGPVWLYRPRYHKLAYRGKPRVIAIGPKAQAVLAPYTPADPDGFYFSPKRGAAEYRAAQAAARRTPMSPSHVAKAEAAKARASGKRRPSSQYTASSYGHAVGRAAERAGVPHWQPNQLRHAHGTDVRRQFGLEAAQVCLGHEKADTTQIYAEADLTLAVRVAAAVG